MARLLRKTIGLPQPASYQPIGAQRLRKDKGVTWNQLLTYVGILIGASTLVLTTVRLVVALMQNGG